MAPAPPKLTVIIPTYNWSGVLRYSIGSVLAQRFADFELLVVGDGCTDDSEAVVGRIGDPRVRWINLPANSGHQSQPNNEGLRQARGDLIAYLGHDDLWLPHHLSSMVAALEAGADVAFAVTAIVGPDGGRIEPAFRHREYRPGSWIPPSGVAHRLSVTRHVGGWRHYRGLAADPEVDLLRRAFDGGHPFQFVPRLTAMKFPAAMRRNVYRDRPHHEQAAWFERMQREADLEPTLLAGMLASSREPRMLYTEPFGHMAREFLRDSAELFRKKGLEKLWRLTAPRRGSNVDRWRQFKGLDRES
jgi:glycosyltransferase involved in cell wall biosynthesis